MFRDRNRYVKDIFFLVPIDTREKADMMKFKLKQTINCILIFDAYISSIYFRIIRESFGMGLDTLIEFIKS